MPELDVKQRLHTPWPDERQTLVLRAALGEGARAVEAWRSLNLIGLDRIDAGSYRLLPLAYRNLTRLGVEDPSLEPLKGAYQRAWRHNQRLLDGGARAIEALQAAGLRTMVLKGAALAVCYYHDAGARAMDDFDLMVPFADARTAIAVLRSAGWRPHDPHPEVAILRHHAEPFSAPRGRELDLHWQLLFESVDDGPSWDAAQPIMVAGVRSLRLHPADQLLHVCVHGSSARELAPIRWVADAMVILREHQEGFPWSRLLEQAAQRQLSVTMGATLAYLRDAFAAPVPEAVLWALCRQSSSRTERWAYRARVTPMLPARKLAIVWERYSKLAALDSPERAPTRLADFLQRLWQLEHRRQLPGELVRRTLRHGFTTRA